MIGSYTERFTVPDRHGKLPGPGAGGGPVTECPPPGSFQQPAAVPHERAAGPPEHPGRGGDEPPLAPIVPRYGSRTPRHLLRRHSPPRRWTRCWECPPGTLRRTSQADDTSLTQPQAAVPAQGVGGGLAGAPGKTARPHRPAPAVRATDPRTGGSSDYRPRSSSPAQESARASPSAHTARVTPSVAPCVTPRVPPPVAPRVAPRVASPHHVNGPRTRAPTCGTRGTRDRPRNADYFPGRPFRRPARPPHPHQPAAEPGPRPPGSHRHRHTVRFAPSGHRHLADTDDGANQAGDGSRTGPGGGPELRTETESPDGRESGPRPRDQGKTGSGAPGRPLQGPRRVIPRRKGRPGTSRPPRALYGPPSAGPTLAD